MTANEPQFTGHFPDRPIMPGVLMIEAMAQLGGIICLSPPFSEGGTEGGQKIFFFTGVSGVRSRKNHNGFIKTYRFLSSVLINVF